MPIELSQQLREKKSILNDILALGFDLDMQNKYGTLIYTNFFANFFYFLFVFDGPPLQCFRPMTAVSISDIFVK